MITRILLALSLLLLVSSYDISFTCRSTNCPDGCKECQVIDGGPFKQNIACVDDSGGCAVMVPFNYTIGCQGCETDCSYTMTAQGQSGSGCINNEDQYWAVVKANLDGLYAQHVDPNNPYQWCTQSCGLSTVILVAIMAGGVAVVGAGVLILVKLLKRKKVQGYQKM